MGSGCCKRPNCWAFLLEAEYNNRTVDMNGIEQHFCLKCMREKMADHNVVGYLTNMERKDYVKDAKRSWEYKMNGYIVFNKNEWYAMDQLFMEWPKGLKELLEENKSVEDLKVLGTRGADHGTRRWIKIKEREGTVFSYNFIHPDIYWGRVAAYKRVKLNLKVPEACQELRENISEGLKTVSCSVLYRGEGTDMDQLPHGDGEPGHHHGVLPATPGYKIHVYPGTHLLHKSFREAKNGLYKVNRRLRKTLTLEQGQVLIFHSSLGHAGASSNETNGKKYLEINQNSIDINWFCGANKGKRVTDLAMHFDIEDKFSSRGTILRNGFIEQLRLREEETDTGVHQSELRAAKEKLKEAAKNLDISFEEAGPCHSYIPATKKTLKRLRELTEMVEEWKPIKKTMATRSGK